MDNPRKTLACAIILGMLGLAPAAIRADEPPMEPGAFTSFTIEDEAVDGYTLRLPEGFDPERAYPLLLSLHSSGQTGGTIETALFHGPGSALKRFPGDQRFERLSREFILVSPHLKEGEYAERQWFDRLETLDSILLATARRLRVDLSRVYVVGYSTGGTGIWGYASRRPGLFAAAIPIAGFSKPDLGIRKPIVEDWRALGKLPIWAFYNAFDRTVRFTHGREAVSAVEGLDGKPFLVLNHDAIGSEFYGSVIVATPPEQVLGQKRIFSIYRIGIHSEGRIWDNPLLYEWLLSHSNPDYRQGSLHRALEAR